MNPNQPPRGRARGRSRPAAERVDPGPIAGSSIASNISTSSSGDGASLQPIGRALARKRQSDVGDLTQQTSQMDVAGKPKLLYKICESLLKIGIANFCFLKKKKITLI